MMFHVGRSGSTVLGDMLGQHPRIQWGSEIYHFALRDWRNSGRRDAPQARDALDLLSRRIAECTKPIYGFEAIFFHLRSYRITLRQFLDAARGMGVGRFIILQRRNTLRTVVSGTMARQSRQTHLAVDAEPAPQRITIKGVGVGRGKGPLLGLLQSYERAFGRLEALLAQHERLTLFYEDDILPGPLAAYRRVCEFLGVEPAGPEVHFGRTTPFPLEQVVANMDELRSALGGTRFAWMLKDES
jgi:hypothetical protein